MKKKLLPLIFIGVWAYATTNLAAQNVHPVSDETLKYCGTDFGALTDYLKGVLWTGDKKLYNGLINKGFKKVVNTQKLLIIRTKQTKK
ncbi:MAG: hypothetical protein V1781_02195 [Bacteroidota bacterium]